MVVVDGLLRHRPAIRRLGVGEWPGSPGGLRRSQRWGGRPGPQRDSVDILPCTSTNLTAIPSRYGGCPGEAARDQIQVPGLKVAVPLAADALPAGPGAPDGPAGEPVLDLVLEGSTLTARARLNGKNYRKMLKTIAEQGAGNVAVVLQGVLRPPAEPGGPYLLEGAGFQVNVKTPTPGPT